MRATAAVLVLAWLAGCAPLGATDGGSSSTPAVVSGSGGGPVGNSTNPSPNPTTTPAPSAVELDAEESAFLATINDYRAQNGLPALAVSATLTAAAKWKSQDMADQNYFSHNDLSGRGFFQRVVDFGYPSASSAGENIAAGNATAQATFAQWKSSAGHNANMLGSSYRAIGIGRAYGSGASYGWYWTTDFGSVTGK